jgi:hypothetical protein
MMREFTPTRTDSQISFLSHCNCSVLFCYQNSALPIAIEYFLISGTVTYEKQFQLLANICSMGQKNEVYNLEHLGLSKRGCGIV